MKLLIDQMTPKAIINLGLIFPLPITQKHLAIFEILIHMVASFLIPNYFSPRPNSHG